MNVLLINAVCGIRSTGRICADIAEDFEKNGCKVKIAYARDSVPEKYLKYAVKIGNGFDVCFHALMSKLFEGRGYWSAFATKKFLKWADEYNPDILWLHNIHDYFINIELLFNWIKSRPKMKVYWTQHDCWAITGGCMHFMASGCEKWKTDCKHCKENTHSFFSLPLVSSCENNYKMKKKLFCGIKDMTLVCPSEWIADVMRKSFLSEYKIIVQKNTVDTEIFKPVKSNFRKNNNLENKIIILGVSSAWSEKKGLYDYYNLANMLDDKFAIVLVGLSSKQMKSVPKNVLGIHKTNSTKQLVEIYSSADVFLNLTYSDTYPTVNLEARACGIPIITYNTGGSPESAGKDAVVIPTGDINAVFEAVQKYRSKR